MMGSTVVDTSQLPLLVITLAGHVDDEPYHQFLANMSAVLDRQQRHATVVDATLAAVAPPGQRRLQAQWFKQEQHRLQKYCVGTAFAFSSPLVRGMLTAIFWLQPMPNAYTIVADVGLATAWARARLQATT